MPEIQFSLSMKLALIVVAAAIAVSLSWFVYRITVPPLAQHLKLLLLSLRAIGLFLVFSLLGEPLLSLVTTSVEPPAVSVLVDNSRSMTIRDARGERKNSLLEVALSPSLRKVSEDGTLRFGLFSEKVRWLNSFSGDSLSLDGDASDIAGALTAVKEQSRAANVQAVVLISDGNATTGSSPLYEAEELNFPVFTVGIGDTTERKDVLVRKLATNDITYVGNRVPVNVTVRSSGLGGQRVEVLLRSGTKVLDRKMLSLDDGVREYEVALSFVPDAEGMQKFTVEVSAAPGELTERNNRSSFFTKVLRSKMRVLLVAGPPSQDVAFVRRSLETDKNLEVRTFVERAGGQFYEGTLSARLLDEHDCLVLVGFPSPASSSGTVAGISRALASGKPALCILNRTLDYTKLRQIEGALPFTLQSASSEEFQVFVEIPEAQRNNTILKLPGELSGVDQWSKLPPIFKTQSVFRIRPESEVLAVARIQTALMNDPFIVSRNFNGAKSLVVLGYGVWRWNLLSDAGSTSVLEPFLSNAVRWLTTREDEQRIRVQTAKQVFTTQEPVEFTGQVYDQSYQPVDNAQIAITVQADRKASELNLMPVGNGRYEGLLNQLEEGDYRFTAKILSDGKQIGEQQGRFSVGGLNAEFLETKMNKQMMQSLANRTGGRYYDAGSIDRLPADIKSLPNFQERELRSATDIELWNLAWTLGLALSIFSLEWFLRKRNGML